MEAIMELDKREEGEEVSLYWMGRPVEELTREELIEVLTDMVALQQQERDTARKDKDFLFGLSYKKREKGFSSAFTMGRITR